MKKLQQIELLKKPFIVTEYEQFRYWCAHCQCYHQAEVPLAGIRAGLFGPNLISLTAYLKGRCHMSYQTMQSFYAEAFGLKISADFSPRVFWQSRFARQARRLNYHTTTWQADCLRRSICIQTRPAGRRMVKVVGYGAFAGKISPLTYLSK